MDILRYNNFRLYMRISSVKVFLWCVPFLAMGIVFVFVLPQRVSLSSQSREQKQLIENMDAKTILENLQSVKDPELGLNLVEMGLIRKVLVDEDRNVTVIMIFTSKFCPFNVYLRKAVQQTIENKFVVNSVSVVIDESEHWDISMMTEEAQAYLKGQSLQ